MPPLALQRLSRTTLPALTARAKAAPADGVARRAALESAVTLLAALPAEAASGDCGTDLRWCALVGLKQVEEQCGAADALGEEGAEFATQLMQLLARAAHRDAEWVSEDVHSVVLPLTAIVVGHRIPLVRLACLQVMTMLINHSHDMLMQYRKQIEAAVKHAIADRRREVRLAAVACINIWFCAASKD